MPDPSTDAVAAGSWFGLHTLFTALAVGAVTYVGFTGAQLAHLVMPDTPSAVAVADPPPLPAPPVAAAPSPEPSPTAAAEPSRSEKRTEKPEAKPSPRPSTAASPDVKPRTTGKADRAPVAERKQPTSIQRARWADRQIAAMLRTMPPSPMSWFTGGATWVLPTTGYHLTARFGESGSHWSTTHTGLDFATSTGTPVRAATGGTVTFAGWDGSYGNKLEIRHPDGTETWYAHLSQLYVDEGAAVATGTVVGAVGATGNVTGPHLHFEIRSGDAPIDPYTALAQRGLHP